MTWEVLSEPTHGTAVVTATEGSMSSGELREEIHGRA